MMLLASLLVVSCNKEIDSTSVIIDETKVPLIINDISANLELATKVGSETTLWKEGKIGLFVEDEDGNPYLNQSSAINNSRWYNGGYWLGNDIYLNKSNATVYSYFPYNESVTDITNIPINNLSKSYYCYGEPCTDINSSNNNININMKYPTSSIKISFLKNSYNPIEGLVTRIAMQSENVGTSGILNAKTGEISSIEGLNEIIEFSFTPFKITNSHNSNPVYLQLISNNTISETTFYFTIDGNDYTIKTESLEYLPGTQYWYKFKIADHTNGAIKFADPRWEAVTFGEITLD